MTTEQVFALEEARRVLGAFGAFLSVLSMPAANSYQCSGQFRVAAQLHSAAMADFMRRY